MSIATCSDDSDRYPPSSRQPSDQNTGNSHYRSLDGGACSFSRGTPLSSIALRWDGDRSKLRLQQTFDMRSHCCWVRVPLAAVWSCLPSFQPQPLRDRSARSVEITFAAEIRASSRRFDFATNTATTAIVPHRASRGNSRLLRKAQVSVQS